MFTIRENHLAIKNEGILPSVTTRVDLEGIVLRVKAELGRWVGIPQEEGLGQGRGVEGLAGKWEMRAEG